MMEPRGALGHPHTRRTRKAFHVVVVGAPWVALGVVIGTMYFNRRWLRFGDF